LAACGKESVPTKAGPQLARSGDLPCFFFAARSPNEFAATVRADLFHLLAAGPTESAFIGTNERLAFFPEPAATFLALRFHNQSHPRSSFLPDPARAGIVFACGQPDAYCHFHYHARAAAGDL
jgi:hypothetical protein